jgi:hypothetical protein
MTTARKTFGNTAEMPREVKILGIARSFRGNGNRNPDLIPTGFSLSRAIPQATAKWQWN